MWDIFIEHSDSKVIVICDEIDVTMDINSALYSRQGLFTILLSSVRPKCNNMKLDDLQVISEIGEAVAYRNYNDVNVNGWVLFVSKEDGLLDSLTSVATIVYKPHLAMIESKMGRLDLSSSNASQVIELLENRELTDQEFWSAIQSENRQELFEVLGLVFKDGVNLKKYNEEYKDIISSVLGDPARRDYISDNLDFEEGEKFREFVDSLEQNVIDDYNFIQEYWKELSDSTINRLLEDLDLPEKSPVKLDVKVRFIGNQYFRLDSNNYFIVPDSTKPELKVTNTSGVHKTNCPALGNRPFEINEGVVLDCIADQRELVVHPFSSSGTPYKSKLRFLSIYEHNLGLYLLKDGALKRLQASKDNELEIPEFSQSSVLYIVHEIKSSVVCHEASIERLLLNQDIQLSKVSSFNTEDTQIELYVGDDFYSLINFEFGTKEIVLVNDMLKKKRAMSLHYGNRVFTLNESNKIFNLERLLLDNNSSNVLLSHHCGEIIVGESTIYSSALDSFDVSDHKCLIQSADLLSNWSKVKSLFLNENYSSTNILSIILNLDPLLIDSYYESYGEALVEDIENASRFLTISLIEDSKLNSVILPLFHPVVLYDLFKYFQEYGVNEKISLNAYCSEVSLRTLLIDTNQLYLLENTGFSQPIFVSDSNNLERIIEYFGLDDTSSVFMSHRPLDDDQIVKSFVAMFEYVGYSKVFNVRLQIDHDQELRGVVRLFKSESVLSSYLTKAKLVLFVDSALFDDLDGYYTEGLKNIHICRVNNEVTYDLLIDARRKEKIKYSFRASDSFNIPTYVLAGMNVFSYEEVNGQSYCVLYPVEYKSHRLLSAPSGKCLAVNVRSNDLEITDYNQSRIISLQIERFNSIKERLNHVVYETQTGNRLKYSATQKSNFVIAIRGTRQLEARLTFSLSQYSLGDHVKSLETGLLNENLFSFSHMFGNRNKMKGVVGELLVYKAVQNVLDKGREGVFGFLIPVDLIVSELKIYFKTFAPLSWSKYPDFLLIRVCDDKCFLSSIEVKSRTTSDHFQVYQDQILPLQSTLEAWRDECKESKTLQKRLIIFLVEYLINVRLGELHSSSLVSLYNWINSDDSELHIDESVIVQLSDDNECLVEHNHGYKFVKADFGNSLDAYLSQEEKHTLEELLFSAISNSSEDVDLQEPNGLISKIKQGQDVVVDREPIIKRINKVDHDLDHPEVLLEPQARAVVDLTVGREDLIQEFESTYRDVRGKLARNGVSINLMDGGVKVSPMNVRFTFSPTEGTSIKNVQSKAADLAVWLKLPQGQKVDIDSDMGNIIMQFPLLKEQRMMFTYSVISKNVIGDQGLSVPIGVDVDGEIVIYEFDSNSPHLLIGGTTGAGKSVALETIIGGLLHRYDAAYLNLIYVDPKGVELIDFEDCKAVQENCLGLKPGIYAEDAIEILSAAAQEMDRRNKLFLDRYRELKKDRQIARGQSVKNIDDFNKYTEDSILPRLLIVLDEYADLVSDKDEKKDIQDQLVRIAQKGRSTGIHLIVATQKPVVDVIDTVVKSNLPGKLALKVANSSDSGVILDEAGAERLLGQGDAYLKIGGEKTRLQIAKFDLFDQLE